MGVLVLLMLLLISALAVLLFLIFPLLAVKAPSGSHRWLPLLYFVAIGLGYIALEITMIQRLVLFLGHPIYAMTVVVFLMLLSSGAGSFTSRHLAAAAFASLEGSTGGDRPAWRVLLRTFGGAPLLCRFFIQHRSSCSAR